jgi:cytochrome c biogenesis protein CcdA/thiol-disulfide isomerase/thioredoxin
VIGLLFIGFVAGIIAGISPCILPVLPVVLVGWTAPVEDVAHPFRARRRRSATVIAGLIISFSLIIAAGSAVLSALGLPQDLLRDVGIGLLILFGIGLLVPQIEQLLERPFARIRGRAPSGNGSAFVLGLGLGAVFVPCAGPVLAAISVLGARHHVSFYSVILSLFFGAGAALPLFAIALTGDRLIEKNRRLSQRARKLRPVAGVLLILMALGIIFNTFNGIQKFVPGYTNALQQHVEGNKFTYEQLRSLSQSPTNDGSLASCESVAATQPVTTLQKCGAAPQFVGIVKWLNTPGDRPLTLTGLRGQVVLVDFWTYSCINCQRSLPHVEAWYARYHKYGLDVIGVQAPEFAFEHVISNIKNAAKNLGVKYPIAVDNNLATWTAYSNEYWPAEYLVDAKGVIRHVAYGEGDYGGTESLIRKLLVAANPTEKLPPPTSVANLTPTQETSPESYLGYDYESESYLVGSQLDQNAIGTYHSPSTIPVGNFAMAGEWYSGPQEITAESNARININFQANDVYLVMSGQGTITETLNGKAYKSVTVSGYPRLYTLFTNQDDVNGLLGLSFSKGLEAYDFTFG